MADLKETPQLFGRHQNLLGIVTERVPWSRQGPGVIILNAGIVHRVGPSRFAVETARFLAEAGHRVLRFDLSGIGDSTPVAGDGGLEVAVQRDIQDAIGLMDGGAGVVLVGLCSGADNAFYVGGDDDRVKGLVLVDPAVHATFEYRLRRLVKRVVSARSWWSVLSGRAFTARYRRSLNVGATRPPGFFGLLTLPRERAVERARRMSVRGVEFLYVLTGGVVRYCNHPGQVRRSLRGAIPDARLQVEWRPTGDHLLTRDGDRVWLRERILVWLERFGRRAAVREGAERARATGISLTA